MKNNFEIIIIGYRWYYESLERTIKSIILTNTHKLRINIGLNSPEHEMLEMLEKYKPFIHNVIISKENIKKTGMQRLLVLSCSAKYVISFDDDTYPINNRWQDILLQRVTDIENKKLRYFGTYPQEIENKTKSLTNNTVGIFGLLFYEWLNDTPDGWDTTSCLAKKKLLQEMPWYNENNILHETKHNYYKNKWNEPLEQIWYCAGSFYVFLRSVYINCNYMAKDNLVEWEDQFISYFYLHYGYRMCDLITSSYESHYTCLNGSIICNDGPRSFNLIREISNKTEHTVDDKASWNWGNDYLDTYKDPLKSVMDVQSADFPANNFKKILL